MLFTDPLFLFYFLPVALLGFRIAAWRNRLTHAARLWLLAATLTFYAYGNVWWVPLFLVVVGGAYLCACALDRCTAAWARRAWVMAAVAHCASLLFVFKYLNWIVRLFPPLRPVQMALLPWFGSQGVVELPPGISFYVFEAISFVVDTYRSQTPTVPTALSYTTFIAMFPRFIAGPIVRFRDVAQRLQQWQGMDILNGLTLFSFGFAMKCLLADQFSVFVPYAFDVSEPDCVQAWIGVIAYSFQLYFDFWGYSLMATGLGVCFGFEFPDNFRQPYHAQSVSDFWRRWHITLSSWLRDYLYIPLGGNRCAPWRMYLNLWLTMAIAGLWHGASTVFVIWGAYHGFLLVGERVLGDRRLALIPAAVRKPLVFAAVVLGWSVFRSRDLAQARQVLCALFGGHGLARQFNPVHIYANKFAAGLAIAGLLFCWRGEKLLVHTTPVASFRYGGTAIAGAIALFLLALVVCLSGAEIPFLYFQF